MTPQTFIATISNAAKISAQATGIPASFTVAEGALESGWGNSLLTTQAKNLFGIKADRSWTGPVYRIQTREFLSDHWVMVYAPFRKYDDWLGSIQDHAAFLRSNPRYSACFQTKNGIEFAIAVDKAGYATDPNYADKITAIIREHNLLELDA